MNAVYRRILEALFEANNCNTPDEQARYLQGLKPAALDLWNAYQQQTGIHRSTRYDVTATQAAYMLRYFPSYSQLVPACLSDSTIAGLTTFNEEGIGAVFFGAGPAPELYGFLQFLKANEPAAAMLRAHLFDVASDEWQLSREINVNRLLPLAWNGETDVVAEEFDLADANAVCNFSGRQWLQAANLVVFQNCLNEIPEDCHTVVRTNILEILRMMAGGRLLLIIERTGYTASEALLKSIEETLPAELFEVKIPGERVFDCRLINRMVPDVVTENLLTRIEEFRPLAPEECGLVLAGNISYHCLAIKRRQH